MNDIGGSAHDQEFRQFLARQSSWIERLESVNWRKRKKLLRKQQIRTLEKLREARQAFAEWEDQNP